MTGRRLSLLVEEKSLSKVLVAYSCISVELPLFSPFYTIDDETPIIIGFDALVAARMIIDRYRRLSYSHFNYIGHSPEPLSMTQPHAKAPLHSYRLSSGPQTSLPTPGVPDASLPHCTQSSDTYDTADGYTMLVKRPLSPDGLNERQPTDVDPDIRSVSSVSDDLPEHVNRIFHHLATRRSYQTATAQTNTLCR